MSHDGGRLFLLRLYRLQKGRTLSQGPESTVRLESKTGAGEAEGRALGFKGRYRVSWSPAGDEPSDL